MGFLDWLSSKKETSKQTYIDQYRRRVQNTFKSLNRQVIERKRIGERESKILSYLINLLTEVRSNLLEDETMARSIYKNVKQTPPIKEHLDATLNILADANGFSKELQKLKQAVNATQDWPWKQRPLDENVRDAISTSFANVFSYWHHAGEYLELYSKELALAGGRDFLTTQVEEAPLQTQTTRVRAIVQRALNTGQMRQLEPVIEDIRDEVLRLEQNEGAVAEQYNVHPINSSQEGNREADARAVNRVLNQSGRGDWRYVLNPQNTVIALADHDHLDQY